MKLIRQTILAFMALLILPLSIFAIGAMNSYGQPDAFAGFPEIVGDLEDYIESLGVWEVSDERGEEMYLFNVTTGYRIEAAWRFDENGELIEIDLIEHAKNLNYSNRLNAEMMFHNGAPMIEPLNDGLLGINYRFYQSSATQVLGTAREVSAEFRGPATISHTTSVSSSQSFSVGANASANRRSAVTVGASFNWTTSSGSQTTTTGTWQVPSGRIGRVWFTPSYNETTGTLWQYYRNSRQHNLGTQWGRSPRMAGQFTDGLFELRTRVG